MYYVPYKPTADFWYFINPKVRYSTMKHKNICLAFRPITENKSYYMHHWTETWCLNWFKWWLDVDQAPIHNSNRWLVLLELVSNERVNGLTLAMRQAITETYFPHSTVLNISGKYPDRPKTLVTWFNHNPWLVKNLGSLSTNSLRYCNFIQCQPW